MKISFSSSRSKKVRLLKFVATLKRFFLPTQSMDVENMKKITLTNLQSFDHTKKEMRVFLFELVLIVWDFILQITSVRKKVALLNLGNTLICSFWANILIFASYHFDKIFVPDLRHVRSFSFCHQSWIRFTVWVCRGTWTQAFHYV